MQVIDVANGQAAKLNRSLKLWQVIVLGLGYLTPLTVFDTFGIVTQETNGHVPAAYLLALAAMLFTASSYGKMVKVVPIAGSAYSYTRQTINPHLGFLVGWVSLLDYVFLPIVNVLLGKIYMSAAFPSVPEWILGVLVAAFVTVINLWKIDGTANVNSLLVAFQVFVVSFFVILAIAYLTGDGGSGVASIAPLYSESLTFPSLMAGAAILCFSFLGFDAVTTYTEETIDPMKNIPRAIFLVALIGGIIFIVASFFSQLAFPDVMHFAEPDSPAPEMSMVLGGPWFHSLFVAGCITAAVASGIASHSSVSRLLYAMGRENVLPKRLFGYLHPRTGIPAVNVILVGIVSLSALFLDLETVIEFINFGALTAFTAVNVCVVAHYFVKEKRRTPIDVYRYLLSPIIGAAFVGYLWWNLSARSLTLGSIWTVIGITYLLYITKGFTQKPPEVSWEEAM